MDKISYEQLDYQLYKKRINTLIKNDNLKKIGIKLNTIANTTYNYPIDCISIGYGNQEIFIIGGTHGSEMISIDFVTQLITNLPAIEEFDPNIFTIKIIPLQNPEGFDISSSTISKNNNFEDISKQYYKSYRIDNIIAITLKELNIFFNNLIKNKNIITANEYLNEIKKFINTNIQWQNLLQEKNLPQIKIFNNLINQQQKINNFNKLKLTLISICNTTLTKLDKNKNIGEIILIENIKKSLESTEIWQDINNETIYKLHQQLFKENLPIKLQKKSLIKDTLAIKVPIGSHILWDATGAKTNINLNANVKTNPGIESIKNNIKKYGLNAKNNIRNYFKGPLGLPTENINNFTYAIENKAIYKLLKKSYINGNYTACILYHGTGGLIYYKPYEQLMETKKYTEFNEYNKEIANIYSKETGYKILETSDYTGYGDQLRRTFPGVLLIELSKMGGNPIGPYGDKTNHYLTIKQNINAFNELLKYFKQKDKNKVRL